MLSPNSATLVMLQSQGMFPPLELPDGRTIERPGRDWFEQQLRWRFLLDSYEGGETYRRAIYEWDLKGMPVRNLIRHKREYPLASEGGVYSPFVGRPAGTDMAAQATDDDYELRRARTPVPTFTAEAVGVHLSKIFNQEIRRKAPPPIEDWWADVDGLGSSMDQWMSGTAAPLLMIFGMLDFMVEHPPMPDGEDVKTRADELRLGLDKAVVSYILPMNMPWAKVDRKDRYVECVVTEHGDDGECQWRYWNADSWTLFDDEGRLVKTVSHGYKRVPIVRCYDKRRPSRPRVGLPLYEPIAEIQREYYNRDSELILSDTLQAHPILQMPEELLKPDGTIEVGPGYVLPMKKLVDGSYQPSSYVDPPKGAAESLRQNKNDLRDAADRAAHLTKPAGAQGTTGQTVSQSGTSKRLDQSTGNEVLGRIAKTLQRAEESVVELAASILGVAFDPDAITVQYPGQFDLSNADETMAGAQAFEVLLTQVGDAPITEQALLSKTVRLLMPGMDDESYDEIDEELGALLERRGEEKSARRESSQLATDPADPTDPNQDPAGPSGADGEPDEGE